MDGTYSEDLSTNVLFRTLKQKYPRLHQNVEKCTQGWFVLVPQRNSIDVSSLTQEAIEAHVVQPSPYFQGEYVTANGRALSIEKGVVSTGEGFSTGASATILFEELFYNRDYKSFRVVCISAPLVGASPRPRAKLVSQSSLTHIPPAIPTRPTLETCSSFLRSPAYPVNSIVLAKLDSQIQEFASTYVMVKGYEHDAVSKVRTLTDKAQEDLICANPDFRQIYTDSDSSHMDGLAQVIETYIMGLLHDRIFPALKDIYREEDEHMLRIMDEFQHIRLGDLGLAEDLEQHTGEGIYFLSQLDHKCTPFDKLFCFQDANNSVANSLSISVAAHKASPLSSAPSTPFSTSPIASPSLLASPPATPSTSMITADELLPLLVYMIVKSRIPNLASTVAYVEHFIMSNISSNSLGYTFVNLQAASQFISRGQLIIKQASKSNSVHSSPSASDDGNSVRRSQSIDDMHAPSPYTSPSHTPSPSQTPFVPISQQTTRSRSISAFFPSMFSQASLPSPKQQTQPPPPSHVRKLADTGKSASLSSVKPASMSSSNLQPRAYAAPPTVISVGPGQDGQLGDFLSSLNNMKGDAVSGSQMRGGRLL
eukprot:TRINITY_DN7481_c0_g1_i6.p1 TRINITY_DN7481_c0_g1~~TRINITY_DN7481_c0_g1_i6.p1  ORF type:complete len:605 (-),score=135.72 TRINITY_DN7481_c0_g1_i6:14-1795(-)